MSALKLETTEKLKFRLPTQLFNKKHTESSMKVDGMSNASSLSTEPRLRSNRNSSEHSPQIEGNTTRKVKSTVNKQKLIPALPITEKKHATLPFPKYNYLPVKSRLNRAYDELITLRGPILSLSLPLSLSIALKDDHAKILSLKYEYPSMIAKANPKKENSKVLKENSSSSLATVDKNSDLLNDSCDNSSSASRVQSSISVEPPLTVAEAVLENNSTLASSQEFSLTSQIISNTELNEEMLRKSQEDSVNELTGPVVSDESKILTNTEVVRDDKIVYSRQLNYVTSSEVRPTVNELFYRLHSKVSHIPESERLIQLMQHSFEYYFVSHVLYEFEYHVMGQYAFLSPWSI